MFLYGALVNTFQCKEYFPDWTMRLYYDDSVPKEFIDKLKTLENVEFVHVEKDGTYGTFWRFLPLFEKDVDMVLVRDVDSRINWRDARCVEEWVDSGKKCLIVRDHDEHYKTKIMAGMFGIKGGLPFVPEFKKYSMIHNYTSDQVFLERHVWDLIKDDMHECGFREKKWMEYSWSDTNFMGLGFDEHGKPRTNHGCTFSYQ